MMRCSSLVPVIMSDSDGLSCLLQVDPGNTGKVGAAEAAQFLKRTGLSDSTLGQVRMNNHVTERLKALRCSAGTVGGKLQLFSSLYRSGICQTQREKVT